MPSSLPTPLPTPAPSFLYHVGDGESDVGQGAWKPYCTCYNDSLKEVSSGFAGVYLETEDIDFHVGVLESADRLMQASPNGVITGGNERTCEKEMRTSTVMKAVEFYWNMTGKPICTAYQEFKKGSSRACVLHMYPGQNGLDPPDSA